MSIRTRARAAVGLLAASNAALTATDQDQEQLTDVGAGLVADLFADGDVAGAMTLTFMTRDIVRWAAKATGIPVSEILADLGRSADRAPDG